MCIIRYISKSNLFMVGTGPFVKYVSSDGGRDGPAKIILAYKGGRGEIQL